MMRYHIVGIGLLGIIFATGCAGKGERIDLKVPIANGANEKIVAMSLATMFSGSTQKMLRSCSANCTTRILKSS